MGDSFVAIVAIRSHLEYSITNVNVENVLLAVRNQPGGGLVILNLVAIQ